MVKRLGNPAEFRVGKIVNKISSSSHHMIVYRTTETKERLTPFDCDPFTDTLDPTKGSPLMVTQKYEDALVLPKGVAFSLDKDQMIRLELHYINTGQKDVQVEATSTFHAVNPAEFQHEAGFLFVGNLDINIPPNSEWKLGPSYFPLPSDYEGSKFFAITGHEHQYGTNVVINAAQSESEPTKDTPVYDIPNWQWDEPETKQFDPPFEIPKGGGFRYTCTWKNPTKATIGFGESANQEMCFFWAYYYPDKGPRVCFQSEKIQGGITECCPGGALCGFLN